MRSNSKARKVALIVGALMTEAVPADSSKPESRVQMHISCVRCQLDANMGTHRWDTCGEAGAKRGLLSQVIVLSDEDGHMKGGNGPGLRMERVGWGREWRAG